MYPSKSDFKVARACGTKLVLNMRLSRLSRCRVPFTAARAAYASAFSPVRVAIEDALNTPTPSQTVASAAARRYPSYPLSHCLNRRNILKVLDENRNFCMNNILVGWQTAEPNVSQPMAWSLARGLVV
jgi:hypothetical protein